MGSSAKSAVGNLAGRVAIVTGGSRGIGAGIAQRLASEGAGVALAARTLEPHPTLPGTLAETRERIERAGGRCLVIQTDLALPSQRASLVETTETQLGPVDILVNNAARAFYEPAQGISDKRFRISLELNFIAPFDLMQRVIPGMRDRKCGWLLNISSTTATSPEGPPYDDFARKRGVATYASSKAALDRMSTGLAAELYEFGIAVNSLSPVAAVLTDAAAALGVIPDDSPTEPVEVMAEAALALCSGDPATLTGRVVTSGALLAELGRPARTLDGASAL